MTGGRSGILGVVGGKNNCRLTPNFRQSTNFAFTFCMIYVIALTLPARKYQGSQTLGFRALWAFGLLFLWYVATADPGLVAWMAIWLVSLVIRRAQALKLVGQVHSAYDGMPINLGSNEYLAKRVYEPICICRWDRFCCGFTPLTACRHGVCRAFFSVAWSPCRSLKQ